MLKRTIISTLSALILSVALAVLLRSTVIGSLGPALPDRFTKLIFGALFIIPVVTITICGFIIGISALPVPWYLHGIILGAIISAPLAVIVYLIPAMFFSPFIKNWGIVLSGALFGFIIELVTTKAFRARAQI